MSAIEFDEDKSILQPLESEIKVPDKGFEGWFYRKIPGSLNLKRNILILIIFILFSVSTVFFVMSRYNVVMKDENYFNRVDNTKLE